MRIVVALVVVALLVAFWIGRDEAVPRTTRAGPPEEAAPKREAPPKAGHEPVRDESQQQVAPKDLPPDPREKGDCSLLLRLFDAGTGKPLRSKVDLWRLGVAANEHWTEGDQLQKTFLVTQAGTQLDGLPPGEYRLVCVRQRRGTEDPPAFRVAGVLTLKHLEIVLPRQFRAYLKVYDENGRLLREGRLCSSGTNRLSHDSRPGWRRARSFKGNRTLFRSFSMSDSSSMGLSTVAVAATDRGFLLGSFLENDGRWTVYPFCQLAAIGRTSVEVRIDCAPGGDRTYRAVALPVDPIRQLVRMPDGTPAVDAGANVTASCLAIPAKAYTHWRDIPIHVRATLQGYRTLEFDYHAGRHQPPQVMQRQR